MSETWRTFCGILLLTATTILLIYWANSPKYKWYYIPAEKKFYYKAVP